MTKLISVSDLLSTDPSATAAIARALISETIAGWDEFQSDLDPGFRSALDEVTLKEQAIEVQLQCFIDCLDEALIDAIKNTRVVHTIVLAD